METTDKPKVLKEVTFLGHKIQLTVEIDNVPGYSKKVIQRWQADELRGRAPYQ